MAELIQLVEGEGMVPTQYSSWSQVGGYFDGDGTVGLDVQLFTVGFYLEFTDNWFSQLAMLKSFFDLSNLRIYMPFTKARHGAYALRILSIPSVTYAAKSMLSYVWKKHKELETTIDYYEGRITGQEAVEAFNAEVSARKRIGKVRIANVPYTYDQGRKMALDFTRRLANEANTVKVTEETQREIVRGYLAHGLSQERLADKYGLSRAVIRRIIGVN